MPLSINPVLLQTNAFRSDGLGPLDFIAHPLEAGHYRGTAYRGDAALGSFEILVSRDGAGEQVDVNLAEVGRNEGVQRFFCGMPRERLPHVVFHTGGKPGGFRVTLQPGTDGASAFDSRRLGKGDLFIFIPVLSGDYALGCDGKVAANATLSVTEAVAGDAPHPGSHGGTLQIGANGFDPGRLEILPGDGAVVQIDTDGVVLIAQMLSAPDERGVRVELPLRYVGPRDLKLQRPRPLRFPR